MELEKFGTAEDVQELLAVREQIDGLLEQHHDASVPRADLFDAGDAYRLVVEVPGVTESDLELALEGRRLVVAGLREPLEDGAQPVFSERPRGHFQRTIDLPGSVNGEAVSAHLQAGLLIIDLPKA